VRHVDRVSPGTRRPSRRRAGRRADLSPWEERVLAGIEAGIADSDPRFARRMSRGTRASVGAALIPGRWLALLPIVLVVPVVAAALVPASAWAVLGLITTLVVLPWLLLCSTEQRRRD
jgi:hypothetical protein